MSDKGSVDVLYENKQLSINGDKKVVTEEFYIKGSKGTKIKFFHKDAKGTRKVTIVGKGDGRYIMITSNGTDKTEVPLETEKDMKKELKGDLKFAKDMVGGSRR
jgi:hypothetical protein